MIGVIKFAAGGGATALLAVLAHNSLGLGASFIDRLESKATSALGNEGGVGVSLTMVREPSLQRVAILSGEADAATQARLLAAIRTIPGIKDARWASNVSQGE